MEQDECMFIYFYLLFFYSTTVNIRVGFYTPHNLFTWGFSI
jgi:hypothetical protein